MEYKANRVGFQNTNYTFSGKVFQNLLQLTVTAELDLLDLVKEGI